MYEILKRALDEALTAAYAGELPVGAEEVTFSEGFEREMRGLIRKTDRPIQKYIPILTAAACAVIAIGCAVLLPRLLSNPIPVEPNETGTATVTSPAPIDEPVESTSAAETDPDEPDAIHDANPGAAGIIVPPDDGNPNYGPGPDEFEDENPGAAGDAADDEDTTEWDDEDDDDDDVGGESGVPAVTGSSSSTVEPYPQDPNDFPATGISDSEETTADDEDDDDDDADQIKIDEDIDADQDTIGDDDDDDSAEDDTEAEEDADYDMIDEDIAVEDEDDVDDEDDDSDDDDVAYDDSEESDMDYDNDEAAEESSFPPIEKRASLNEEVQALIGCSLADSYLHSGNFMIDGKFYDLPIVEGIDPETYRDPELAELIGAAKYIEGEPEERGLPLFWGNVGKEAPVTKPAYESDRSDRNQYDELYFGESSRIDDEEDEIDTPVETVYLEFLRNGIVCVFMDGYSGTVYYRLDDEALEQLTARIETRFQVSGPKTVGDLRKQLGSAEDYARVYVSISNYYDCTMSGALSDGSFLADLLQKYKNEKLQTGSNSEYAPIRIDLVSRKSLRTEYFVFYTDGTVRVGDDKFFKIDETEVRAILTEYCRQKNLPAPVFYETLGEYLTGKNFTTLTEASLYGKDSRSDLLLSGDSAELRALIEEYAEKSTFLPRGGSVSYREQGSIRIRVDGWFYDVRINRDVIQIGITRNIFRTPDGLYDKLCAIISENGGSPYAEQDEDYFDDDVAYEEVAEDVED